MQKLKQPWSLKEMFADYRANRFDDEIRTDWGSALFYRPVGIVLARLVAPSGISPNAITAIGVLLLPAMIAAAAICQPEIALAIVLSLAVIYLILDCTDGPLARATGQVSVSGHYWDLMADLAYRGCIYATIGYLADHIHSWTLPVNHMSCLTLAAWLALLARLARKNLTRLAPRGGEEKVNQGKTASFTVYSFLSGMDTLFPPFVAITSGLGVLSIYIGWIVFYSFADVVVALNEAYWRFKSLQN
jgi:phosphatidylglycerophosphate synthase